MLHTINIVIVCIVMSQSYRHGCMHGYVHGYMCMATATGMHAHGLSYNQQQVIMGLAHFYIIWTSWYSSTNISWKLSNYNIITWYYNGKYAWTNLFQLSGMSIDMGICMAMCMAAWLILVAGWVSVSEHMPGKSWVVLFNSNRKGVYLNLTQLISLSI